jgi:hypothetical protein
MPLTPEDEVSKRSTRDRLWLWLLGILPTVLIALLLATAWQPLELGSVVAWSRYGRRPGRSWRADFLSYSGKTVEFPTGQNYELFGSGAVLMLQFPTGYCCWGWFPGRRISRDTR